MRYSNLLYLTYLQKTPRGQDDLSGTHMQVSAAQCVKTLYGHARDSQALANM